MTVTQQTFRFGGLEAAPGTTVHGFWPVAPRVGGQPVSIPLVIVNGAHDGPTIWVQAAAHGDEYHTIAAVMALARELSPGDIHGRVILATMVNPPSVENFGPTSSIDGRNLEASFPGSKSGTASEVLAATVLAELEGTVDYAIDLHDGGSVFGVAPFVLYHDDGTDATRELAEAFGFRLLVRTDSPTSGAFYVQASTRGVTAIHAEAGWGTQVMKEPVGLLKKGVRNVLASVGVLPEHQITRSNEYITLTIGGRARTSFGGFAEVVVEPGSHVNEGDLVAIIRDSFGETLEEIRAPATGYMLDLLTRPVVGSGDLVTVVGSEVGSGE